MARRVFSRFLVRRLLLLAALGVGVGHIEAVAVVYVRRLLGWVPLPAEVGPESLAGAPGWLIHAEQTREVATLIVLLAVAWVVGRNVLERLGTFLFALGVWKIAHYVSLRVMIDWPESLRTVDRLLLIPHPWYAPVWLPIVCSLAVIAAGTGILLVIDRHIARTARHT